MSRWQFLKCTLAAAMLCGLLLSPRLWLSARSYPLVPVWDGLPTVRRPGTGSCWAYWSPRWRPSPWRLVRAGPCWSSSSWRGFGAFGTRRAGNRGSYQYLAMFAVLALGPAPEDPARGQASLNACRLIVAGMYFWSGLQKLNVLFAANIFPWLMDPVLKHLPGECHEYLSGRGWEAACMECAVGLGLLAWPLRQVALVGPWSCTC